VGSFVLNEATSPGTTLEPFRYRILGLFDAVSGNPLPDVDVIDSTTGSWMRTSPTGTVSLAFLSPGPSTVRLRRAGVIDTLVHVMISPRDTTPITLVFGVPR
jgi:hypothetical protein